MTSSLRVRLGILLGLYIAQGLPMGIFNQALPAILRSHGVSLTVISLTSLLALPWALKMLWAPWVDRYHFPGLGPSRSWVLPLQAGCCLMLMALAAFDPDRLATHSGLILFFAAIFALNLMAATQDIASDALAVRILERGERAAGNSVQVAGYRLGLITGGGMLLYLLGSWSWREAFWLLAALMGLLTLPVLFFRENAGKPADDADKPRMAYRQTFLTLVKTPAFRSWLGVLLTYKLADGFGSAMVKPMLVDLGFNLKQMGLQISVLGSAATVAGALLGGWLTSRWGRYPALVVFSIFQALSLGTYAWIARHGNDLTPAVIYAVNALEHLATGLATVGLLTVVMDHCRHQNAGTDFTVQVSLLAMTGGLAHLLAGPVAEHAGYTFYYLLAMGVGLAAVIPVVQWGRDSRRLAATL